MLLTWWIFWIVTHSIAWSITKQMISTAYRDDITIPQAIGLMELQAWSCMISLVIAGLWFWVANLLTQRLLDRTAIPVNAQSVQRDIHTSNPTPVSKPIVTPAPAATEAPTITPSERREAAIDLPEAAPSRMTIAIPAMPESDDWAFEKVADELETSTRGKALWTRAFAESGGDENKAKALYIQRRVDVLVEAERKRLAEEHARDIEAKRQRNVQAELTRMRDLKARQDEETHRREAEALGKGEQEKAEAAEKARQAEELTRRRHELQEAKFDELEKVAAIFNPPNQGMSAGAKFILALGIAALILAVLFGSGGPDKPAATSAATDYVKMPVTDLQARAATDSAAAYELMIRYHLGAGGVDKNMPESLRWGEIAANAGHARAQAMIGWYYTAGLGVPSDKQKGLMWLEKAAAQNDAMGLSNLGWRYQIGDGVPLDYSRAREYAQRATDLGDNVGRNNLGEIYEQGLGVPKDYAKALELFEPIAVKGSSTDSRLGMIRIYADQAGNYNYPVLAYAWLRIALDRSRDKEELAKHLDELSALRFVLEGRLTPAQLEEGRNKAANWQKGQVIRP